MKVMYSGEKAFMERNMDVFAGIPVVMNYDAEDIYGSKLLEVTVEGDEKVHSKISSELNARDDGSFGGAVTIN